MIQITPQMRILLAVDPVDFRKGIDSLAGFCRNTLNGDPFSGCMFVFRNRSRTSMKILVYDGNGFWICQKRLSKGRLKWWPQPGCAILTEIEARTLQVMIWNGIPEDVHFASHWRRIKVEDFIPAA